MDRARQTQSKNRRYCEHCEDYESLSVYFRHKKILGRKKNYEVISSDSENERFYSKQTI